MMYYLKSTLNEYVPPFIWKKSRYLSGGNSSWMQYSYSIFIVLNIYFILQMLIGNTLNESCNNVPFLPTLFTKWFIFLRVNINWIKMLGVLSCPTLWDPMDCRPPGSSVHGILQARMLESVSIPLSRGSSQTRAQT